MDDPVWTRIISVLLTLPLVSTLVVGISLFLYAIFNDYVLFHMVQIAEDLVSSGLMGSDWLNPVTHIQTLMAQIPAFVDYLFLISFVGMVLAMAYSAYRTNRNDYWDIFSYMTFGMMVFLFLLSIVKLIANYVYNLFFNIILENLTVELTYFTFFYNNLFLISLGIIALMLVMNYIDLNNFKFSQKKAEEINPDEV